EVGRRDHVLTVPNEALRWQPEPSQLAPDVRAAFQKAPQRGRGSEGANNRGVVWVQDGKFVRPVAVRLGLADGARAGGGGGGLEGRVTGDAGAKGGADGGSNPFTPQMFGGKKQ